MSLSEQIQRVDGSQNSILSKIAESYGIDTAGLKIDELSAAIMSSGKFRKGALLSDETAALYGLGINTEITVDLSTVQEGDIIQLPKDGVLTDFLVATLNYQQDLNGTGFILLEEVNNIGSRPWDSEENAANYAETEIDVFLENEYVNSFPESLKSAIKTTKIQYTKNQSVAVLERHAFLPSIIEFGQSSTAALVEGVNIPLLGSVVKTGGAKTRTISKSSNAGDYFFANDAGNSATASNYRQNSGSPYYVYPCFCLPPTFKHTWYVNPSSSGSEEVISIDLSTKNAGDTVTLVQDGKAVDFMVGVENYESSLNGEGHKLLFPKSVVTGLRPWDAGNVNAYAESDIDAKLNGEYLDSFPSVIKNAIPDTVFKYTPGNGNTTLSNLKRKVFLPSMTETGVSYAQANIEGTKIDALNEFLINSGFIFYTRSPDKGDNRQVIEVNFGGDGVPGTIPAGTTGTAIDFLPFFCLPSDFKTTIELGGQVSDEPVEPVVDDVLRILSATKIYYGEYIGTGKSGINNKNTLLFDRTPKAIVIQSPQKITNYLIGGFFWFKDGGVYYNVVDLPKSSVNTCTVSFLENTIEWYSNSSPIYQLNSTGLVYKYIAFFE